MAGKRPASRPPGIVDKRQALSSIDAAIDNLKRLRERIDQMFERPQALEKVEKSNEAKQP